MLSNFDQAFRSFESSHIKSPSWVQTIRKNAKEACIKAGLPSVKDENWKYTNLRILTSTNFDWSESKHAKMSDSWKSLLISNALNIIFVDGKLLPHDGLESIRICSLDEAFEQFPEQVKEALSLCSTVYENPLTQLNDAFLSEGCFIHVPAKVEASKLIHILNILTENTSAKASFPRKIVYLEKGAKISLIESFVSVSESTETLFTNSITDIVLNERSEASFAKFQKKGDAHYYIGHTRLFQKADSKAYSFFDIGHSALSRESICVKLLGERAESRIRGIFHTLQKHHVDYSVFVDHAASFTKSRQLFKGVAEDQSRGVFNAHIRVREGLRKIDAHQLTKNLLLGSEAEIDAKPHLEIDSDDVKCAHGAAVGRLRAEEVFYLQSRGMTRSKAEKILSTAFTQEVVLDVQDEAFRENIVRHEQNFSPFLKMSIS